MNENRGQVEIKGLSSQETTNILEELGIYEEIIGIPMPPQKRKTELVQPEEERDDR